MNKPSSGYSAQVSMWLNLDDRRVDIAATGPNYIILRKPEVLPECPAVLVMSIDGELRTWRVMLEGPGAGEGEIRIRDLS